MLEFAATHGGPVTFGAIGGQTKLKAFSGGSWDAWDEEIAQFTEGDFFRNGLPVLRHVVSLTSDWVRREKPFRFYFEAVDERKHRIYLYLVARHLAPLSRRYVHFMDGNRFWFVRTDEGVGFPPRGRRRH